MARRNISWTTWSLCDKDETFAALVNLSFPDSEHKQQSAGGSEGVLGC